MVNTDPNRSLAVRVQQMLETYQETKQREWKCCGKSYDASQIVNHLNSDQCSKKEKPWTMIPEICRDGCGLPTKIWFKWFNESEVGYEYKCSCLVQKFIQENDIQRVEVKTETTMVFEYGDKRRVEISVNNANLELVRDYYKDKYQNEVIAKEQAELAEIERLRTENIYGLTTKHIIGWLIFSILALTTIYFIRKYTNKLKKKKSENLKEEIRDKFKLWRLNMGLSVLFYAVSFYLLQQAINKWIRPNIKQWLKSREDITILSVTGILGILFLVDSYISSELKTPLQRLAMKIENAGLDEKEKKELLSKTQWSNENFKETLKRFGLLTIAGALIKLLGKAFDAKFVANFCYAIPIAFGGWQIWEIGRKIKKIEK